MNLQLTLPLEQDQIELEVARVKEALRVLDEERRSVMLMLHTIQSYCNHPKRQEFYDESECLVCGKSW